MGENPSLFLFSSVAIKTKNSDHHHSDQSNSIAIAANAFHLSPQKHYFCKLY